MKYAQIKERGADLKKIDSSRLTFTKGIRDGIPICLGYLSVSFTFGMMVVEQGYPGWLSVLISMTNLTSAGQFAGTDLMINGGTYIEIAITTFVINIRYMLMSLSLTQKIDSKMSTPRRLLMAFTVTDEIFAVSSQQKGEINSRYFLGLSLTPYFGWAVGTFLGATVTAFLPAAIRSALGIAIYGMFLAIIIPPARKSRAVLLACVIAGIISCAFYYIPGLNLLSRGWVIIICAIVAAGFCAWKFPVKDEDEEEALQDTEGGDI